MAEQILEGTWEEIALQADAFIGKRLRLTVIEDAPQPNYAMLEALRKAAEMQGGMAFTSGEDTQRLLREARDGRMYGYEPNQLSQSGMAELLTFDQGLEKQVARNAPALKINLLV